MYEVHYPYFYRIDFRKYKSPDGLINWYLATKDRIELIKSESLRFVDFDKKLKPNNISISEVISSLLSKEFNATVSI